MVGVVAADYDNDGRTDLFALGRTGNRLLHQRPDGRFEDLTGASAVGGSISARSAAFADVDHDGDLDLFIAGWGEGIPTRDGPAGPSPPDYDTTRRPDSRRMTTTTSASSSSRWMKPDMVYEVTIPSSHIRTRITARVSSIGFSSATASSGRAAHQRKRPAPPALVASKASPTVIDTRTRPARAGRP